MDIATNVIHRLFLMIIPNKQQNNLIHPFSYISVHVTMIFKEPMTRTEKLSLILHNTLMESNFLDEGYLFLSRHELSQSTKISTDHVIIILICKNTLDFNH